MVDDSSYYNIDMDTTPTAWEPVSNEPKISKEGVRDRVRLEKMKEERRAQRMATPKTDRAITPCDPSPPHLDIDVSPNFIYSQMTDVDNPPGKKKEHRLTRDIAAARAALVDKDEVSRTRRSSSVGSYGVIRFDGGEEDVPEGPRSAPILDTLDEEKVEGVKDTKIPDRAGGVETPSRIRSDRTSARTLVEDTVPQHQSFDRVPRSQSTKTENPKSTESGKSHKSSRTRDPATSSETDRSRKEGRPNGDRPTSSSQDKSASRADIRSDQQDRVRSTCSKEKEKGGTEQRTEKRDKNDPKVKEEKPRHRIRLEDLTPEQVEQMQKEREKRRVRKAREAKEARGEGSSGLSVAEKAGLPSP